jgi:hypothetical protein
MEDVFAKLIDRTLTYNNALNQGYYWIMDVIRSEQGKIFEPEYILSLVQKKHHRLGLSWAGENATVVCGVYKPRDEIKLT